MSASTIASKIQHEVLAKYVRGKPLPTIYVTKATHEELRTLPFGYPEYKGRALEGMRFLLCDYYIVTGASARTHPAWRVVV